MERYIKEKGLSIDPTSIDFTVRGAKNSKKPNIVRAQERVKQPKKEKTPTKVTKPKVKVPSKTKSPEGKSPKSPKKTLTQKLVIKMNFSTPPKDFTTNKIKKRRPNTPKTETVRKVEAKGVKRKADKLIKPPSKKAKVIVNGKAKPKAVRAKATLPKPKRKEEKVVKDIQLETEFEKIEQAKDEEREDDIEEVDNSDEEESVSDDEVESNDDRLYNQVDASDYRYSLEEIDLNQVHSDDSDEEIVYIKDNDIDNNESYEKGSPFVDRMEPEESDDEDHEEDDNDGKLVTNDNGTQYTAVEQKVVVLSNPEFLSNPDIIIGEHVDTDDDSVVQESVDTGQYMTESEEETEHTAVTSAEENNDIEKVERLLNRTEGMTVQDAYEASVRLGHFSDFQAQRRSPRATPSKYGNSARRSSYEKSRSFSDTFEWDTIRTRRKSQTMDNQDVNENNNNSINRTEEIKNNAVEIQVSDTKNTKANFEDTKTESLKNTELSPKPRRKAFVERLSVHQSKRRKSAEIAKSPARSPRARRVSEPVPSVENQLAQEKNDDDRYGPDGECRFEQSHSSWFDMRTDVF